MVQRVYEGAQACHALDKLVVATDDERIFQHVQEFGGDVVLTSENHRSGTDRCGEVLESMEEKFDVVINIQGDEPFIDPGHLDLVIKQFEDPSVDIATLAIAMQEKDELHSPNTPKVVMDKNQNALYFSRQAIPFQRNQPLEKWNANHPYWKHIGLYAFKAEVLRRVVTMEASALEIAESLEQLRWLENGLKIRVGITEIENITIDSPEDLKKLD